MPLTKISADAFGVLTICLVALLILLCVFCIIYSCYFRSRTRNRELYQLTYFSGPWVIRIVFILFAIWWAIGEIIRLSLLRNKHWPLHALSLKWQEVICKGYIVSNIGLAEPCLFLTLVFLLRAPLQRMESAGILGRHWNGKTIVYVLLYCLPLFVLQLVIILLGPQLSKGKRSRQKLPHYFTSAMRRYDDAEYCSYPLLSTILLGLFALVLMVYLFWVGRRILKLVINKGLQKRVYALLFSVSSFLPLRIILLGLSILPMGHLPFEALTFLAFLSLVPCVSVCIFFLVYCPVADSLALGNLNDLDALRRLSDDQNETVSLVANQSHFTESSVMSPGRNSDASTKRGSISFRTYGKDGPSTGTFVELSLFSPSRDATPPDSPPLLGWPMRPPTHLEGP